MATAGAIGSGVVDALLRASVAVIACCAALAGGAAVAQAQLTWSAPIGVNKVSGVSLTAVACPSATQCAALDTYGRVVTFNPASPGRPTPIGFPTARALHGIDCPSVTQCTAVGGGQELTFNPQSPGAASAVTLETGTSSSPASLGRVACPSSTQCTAIDKTVEITFNPVSPGTPPPVTIDAGAQVGLTALACPAPSQCTAIDGDGKELTFDPTSTAAPHIAQLVSSGLPLAIACPLSTQCTLIDQNGREVTFNPVTPGTPTPTTIDSEQLNGLLGIACRSATSCTAVSQGAREVTFNPQSPGAPTPVHIDTSAGGNELGQNTGISAISCPAAGACTAVDGNGQELTFNPDSPGTPSPVRIDSGNMLLAVSCPLETQCTAIDDTRQVTFDPVAPHSPTPTTIFSGFGIGLDGIACPTATQCTAVRATDELTFNPRAPHKPKPKTIDPASDEGIRGITCTSAARCTVADANSQEAFFDPRTGRKIKIKFFLSAGSFVALSCPSQSQCTAVDNGGGMQTFVPRTGKLIAKATIDTLVGLDAPSGGSNDELDAISCPTLTRCTAVDTLGNEVTFNPRSSHAATPQAIDAGIALRAVACPSVAECVAVDSAGRALLGDPATGTWTVEPIVGATPLQDISCPSTAECIAVDSIGNAFLAAGHSAAELRGWLSKLLVPGSAAAKIGAVRKAGGYKLSFAGLYPLTLRIRWFQVPPGAHLARSARSRKPVLVASGSVALTNAADGALKIRLTGAGRRLLGHAGSLKLTASGTLTAAGQKVGGKQAFKLRS